MDEIEKMIEKEYKELDLLCGCEQLSFELYRLYRLEEIKNR